jgi:predicted GNAT family N-acyltransferase
MDAAVRLITREPENCDEKEFGDFVSLVMAGGEVAPRGLEARVRRARQLIFFYTGQCLSAVAALKQPRDAYRKSVNRGAHIELDKKTYPFELGWVFVMPSARGRKYSIDLTRAAIEAAAGKGIFATSRVGNHAMHAALKACGFLAIGEAYSSSRGVYKLQVFVRPAIRTPDRN